MEADTARSSTSIIRNVLLLELLKIIDLNSNHDLTVPIFPLEFVESRKDIANARVRKPTQPRQTKLSFRGSTNLRGKIVTTRSL